MPTEYVKKPRFEGRELKDENKIRSLLSQGAELSLKTEAHHGIKKSHYVLTFNWSRSWEVRLCSIAVYNIAVQHLMALASKKDLYRKTFIDNEALESIITKAA